MISGLLQIQSFYIIRFFQMLGELKFLVYNWELNTKQVSTMEENSVLTMQLWLSLVMYDYRVWLASVLQIHVQSLISQLLKMLHIKKLLRSHLNQHKLGDKLFLFSKDRRKFIMLSLVIHGCYEYIYRSMQEKNYAMSLPSHEPSQKVFHCIITIIILAFKR